VSFPLEFNYDFIGVNAGMYEAKSLFCPQPAPIKICLAGTAIHACTEEKRRAIELLTSCYMKHAICLAISVKNNLLQSLICLFVYHKLPTQNPKNDE